MTEAADQALWDAQAIVRRALAQPQRRATVHSQIDQATYTVSHVIGDPASAACAIVDSVLDYDAASGRTSQRSAQQLIDYVRAHALEVAWLLETHAHADHLSAAPVLKQQLGGTMAIGTHITDVQQIFGQVFNAGPSFHSDGSQFDRLFADGERFAVGGLEAIALHVPGHTPACMAYVIGDTVFVGDTLFMPDYGTARCDFPGGDAATLFRSIRRLQRLPDATRVFLCHDYKAPGRDRFVWETTMGAQREANVHAREGVVESAFVEMREARDKTLPMPALMLPSVQVNMRGGRLPDAENNGIRYLKIPIDAL
jgi:glyoxylase-like metal-dependent hydrolase (beta-lactamase superfamily II)